MKNFILFSFFAVLLSVATVGARSSTGNDYHDSWSDIEYQDTNFDHTAYDAANKNFEQSKTTTGRAEYTSDQNFGHQFNRPHRRIDTRAGYYPDTPAANYINRYDQKPRLSPLLHRRSCDVQVTLLHGKNADIIAAAYALPRLE